MRSCSALDDLLGPPPREPDVSTECSWEDPETRAWCESIVWYRYARDLERWAESAVAWCSWQGDAP